jgi:Cyclopropane fatty acid synthase and related methyltransferases
MAKIDLALNKLNLQPGMTLLDVGGGWGSVMKRAVEKHDVNVLGLTLSKNQSVYCRQLLEEIDSNRSRQVFLRGWEQFDEPSTASSASRRSRRFRRTATRPSSRRATASCRPVAGWCCRRSGPSPQALADMGIPIT